MFIIYDLIFLVVALIYLPLYLFKGKIHRGFLLRLGIIPGNLVLKQPIWIHAVSVGEVIVIKGLLEELRKTYPNKRFVISTVTPTGNKIAKGIAKETDFVTYLPLDFSFITQAVIDKINPSLFIIAETEIWPNLISCLCKKKIPIIIVNGRISDSSYRGYLCIKFLLKPILDKVNLFCLQTHRDSQRLMRLGVSQDKIQITGNMKFDLGDYTDSKIDYTDFKQKLGLKSEEKLFLAASTHSGEEEIVLDTYKKLLSEFVNLRLLIAPRHPPRTKEVEKIVIQYGFNPKRISQLNETTKQRNNESTEKVFILDTVGELISFYAIADIVFVGGSLIKKGGHNILEPISLGKPVLFGPYMFNFRDIAELFINNQAAILVHNQKELKEKIEYLLNNPSWETNLGQRAKALILQNQGATQKTLGQIKTLL